MSGSPEGIKDVGERINEICETGGISAWHLINELPEEEKALLRSYSHDILVQQIYSRIYNPKLKLFYLSPDERQEGKEKLGRDPKIILEEYAKQVAANIATQILKQRTR